MECDQDARCKTCLCTYMTCDKRGNCCACVAYHRNRQEVPGCLFSKAGEATWDRSFKAFCKDRQGA